MPAFARHAWRAAWLSTRMAEPPQEAGKPLTVPRSVVRDRLRDLFQARQRWTLTEAKRELLGIPSEAISSSLQWLIEAKEIARVGHGIYERAAGNTAGEQRRQRPTPPGLRPW